MGNQQAIQALRAQAPSSVLSAPSAPLGMTLNSNPIGPPALAAIAAQQQNRYGGGGLFSGGRY
jgi:hypothetical protein